MTLEIVSPDSIIYTGKVHLAQFPGIDGSFEIMDQHAPIISILKKGQIKVIDEHTKTLHFEIKGGVLEVKNNRAIVLAE